VPGERANGDVIACVFYVGKVRYSTDVDKDARLRKTEFHERNKAVAARQELCFISVFSDETDRLFC
jgi:hypothetical protein